MNGIPEATPIRLMEEERAELLSLARSTKTEYRMRQRARIVLLAAEGMASRAIGRESWLHHRNGLEVAGALCARPLGRAGRDRRPRRRTQIHGGDRQAHSGGTRPTGAGRARPLERSVDRSRIDVDVQYVWRFLRAQKIDLTARK